MRHLIDETAIVADHGGSIARAEARFGRPSLPWIDLSTGINPNPYPIPAIPSEAWTRLPDPAAEDRLRAITRRYFGAPEDTPLALAPGSQALIQTLAGLFPPLRIAIVGFTYAEHALCWSARGHHVVSVAEPEVDADVVIVVNPNNPDGRRHPPERLLAVADRQARRGGALIVDEAFVDPTPDLSLAPHAGRGGLVILRSFGKFFGLAGVRLGIALGPDRLVRAMGAALGPWAVSGPALTIAAAAYSDEAWIGAERSRLDRAAADLDRVLTGAGLRVAGGTSSFRLVEDANAPAIHERLARAGLLVRAFDAAPARLRFGLPPDRAALDRLSGALRGA